MTTIVTIASGDQISNSRADLNTNFAALNAGKIESSWVDTDTTLAANSDSRIPTQKAVKAYVDSLGNINASTTARGVVQQATQVQVDAGTSVGSSGASLFVTPATLAATSLFTIGYKNGVSSRAGNAGAGNLVIAHGLGKTPKKVKVTAFKNASTDLATQSVGVYNGTTTSTLTWFINGGTDAVGATDSTYIVLLYDDSGASNVTRATCTVDATNITLAFNPTGTPSATTNYLMWEVE